MLTDRDRASGKIAYPLMTRDCGINLLRSVLDRGTDEAEFHRASGSLRPIGHP